MLSLTPSLMRTSNLFQIMYPNISRLKASTTCGSTTFYSPQSRFSSTSQESGALISDANRGLFHLYHLDLGIHNFLVEDDYNILALIDSDGACTLPSEYSAVHPMSLRGLPKVFWRGSCFENLCEEQGPLDQKKRQAFEDTLLAVETKNGQVEGYLNYLELGILKTHAAYYLRMSENGSNNPLEKLYKPLESSN